MDDSLIRRWGRRLLARARPAAPLSAGASSLPHPLLNAATMLGQESKSVTIEIDVGDLKILKANGYLLCFARRASSDGGAGEYDVLWQATGAYLSSNDFSWTARFELFGCTGFADRAPVSPNTNRQPVGIGQQCVLDADGVLGPPSAGGPTDGITMVNRFGLIHPGLGQFSTLNGNSATSPFYVARYAAVQGEATLTPIDALLVWFEQNVAAGTMFSTPRFSVAEAVMARSNSVEIDLSNADSATLLYRNQQWATP